MALDYKHLYPKAAEEVASAFYVDDYLSGAETLNEAKKLYCGMEELMNRGQFQLRKWRSNSRELLQIIPDHDQKQTKSSLQKYHPFIDDFGILRVGGRLEHSHLAYTRRHPILFRGVGSKYKVVRPILVEKI